MMKNIVICDWLRKHLEDDTVVIVDCRFDLADVRAGEQAYKETHIPGAIYFDLEKHLSGPKQTHGGRHPLPSIETFVKLLGDSGIDQSKTVVAYDAQGGAMAARLWWMLKYLGHPKVYLLDGGYGEWVQQSYPTSTEISRNSETRYIPNIQNDRLVTIDDIRQQLHNSEVALLDARSEDRYRGENEHIDPKAGHIPSALNHFWQKNLKDGKWRTAEELKSLYKPFENQKVISYCGSGVTACVNILAMEEIGIKSKLYVGSWSDWSSYDGNEIETKGVYNES
jgi:thiosulfate/3-mercaptopyruvate sulfurtransferase